MSITFIDGSLMCGEQASLPQDRRPSKRPTTQASRVPLGNFFYVLRVRVASQHINRTPDAVDLTVITVITVSRPLRTDLASVWYLHHLAASTMVDLVSFDHILHVM